ncbi:MAG TPA: hypothetical protein VMV80_04565 [Anaerolineales bacterium]|nr:hypothetical protein [Anaerolineales bacterium]
MRSKTDFYICPVCFRVCETESECHQHKMILCHTGEPGDERRKPVTDHLGNPVSRAPRWYLEALGWIEAK